MTPYGAAKLVNAALKAEGIDKVIPPQMMYNYTKGRLNSGKKPFIEFTEEGGVDVDSFNKWLEGYISRQVKPSEKSEPSKKELDEIEAESVS